MIARVDVGSLVSLAAVVVIYFLARARGKSFRASADARAYASGFGAGVASSTSAAAAVNHTNVTIGPSVGNGTADQLDHTRHDHDITRDNRFALGQSMHPNYLDGPNRMGELPDGSERRQPPVGPGDFDVVRGRVDRGVIHAASHEKEIDDVDDSHNDTRHRHTIIGRRQWSD